MIIILKPDLAADGPEVRQVQEVAARYPKIKPAVHTYKGVNHTVTEVHLIGED